MLYDQFSLPALLMNQKLVNFIKSQATDPNSYPRSLWFEESRLKVYLRAGKTYSYNQDGNLLLALTVSNVEVEEKFRRQGVFTNFVMGIIQLGVSNGYTELQMENVITLEMVAYCQKHEMQVKKSPYNSVDSYYMSI